MKINCPEDTSHLPRELADFARRQIVNATMYRGAERHSKDRYYMMLPVRAAPVDENNLAIGPTAEMITRDISASATSILHMDEITDPRLVLQMTIAGTEVNVVIDVVWSNALGPFYGAGGTFSAKLDWFPG